MSQKRVSGFPEKRRTSGEVRGTSGEVRGTSGKFGELPGKFGELPVKFHSERTSGEVAENFRGSSGNFQGSPGTSGEARGSLTPSQRLAKSALTYQWRSTHSTLTGRRIAAIPLNQCDG